MKYEVWIDVMFPPGLQLHVVDDEFDSLEEAETHRQKRIDILVHCGFDPQIVEKMYYIQKAQYV